MSFTMQRLRKATSLPTQTGKASCLSRAADHPDTEIDVRVEARDDSGRTISTRLGIFNYPAAIDVRARTANWFARPGFPRT